MYNYYHGRILLVGASKFWTHLLRILLGPKEVDSLLSFEFWGLDTYSFQKALELKALTQSFQMLVCVV